MEDVIIKKPRSISGSDEGAPSHNNSWPCKIVRPARVATWRGGKHGIHRLAGPKIDVGSAWFTAAAWHTRGEHTPRVRGGAQVCTDIIKHMARGAGAAALTRRDADDFDQVLTCGKFFF